MSKDSKIKNYFLAIGLTQDIAMARVYMALSMYAYISSALAFFLATTDRVTPWVCLIGVVSSYLGTHLVEIGKSKIAKVIRPLFALGIIIYSSHASGGLSSPMIYWFFSIVLGVMFSFGMRPGMLATVVLSIISMVYYVQGSGSPFQLTILLLTLPNTFVIGLLFSKVSEYYLKKFEREKVKVEQSLEAQKKLTLQVEASAHSIKLILDTIKEGIIKFGPDFQVLAESSRWAFQLFQFAPGDNILHYLDKLEIGDDLKNASAEALKTCLGESELNWDANESNLVKEAIYQGLHLSLHWTPVIRVGIVEECILSIVDNTEKLKSELLLKSADEKSTRLLNKAKILVSGNVRACQSFMADAPRLLLGLDQLFRKGPDSAAVLRNLHTVKGAARTLRMRDLAEMAHAIEEDFRSDHVFIVEKMCLDLIRELDEYAIALHEVLGMSNISGRDTVYDIVTQIRDDLLERLKAHNVQLEGITVTDKLGVVPTEVKDILLHALTNAIDHGFIFPLERGQTITQAELYILAFSENGSNYIKVIDNGIGINWPYIDSICEKKAFVPSAGRSKTDVLFLGGSSTAGHVTATSGRGIGMSAIKMAVDALHGEVQFGNCEKGSGSQLLVSWPTSIPSVSGLKKAG